MTESNLWVYYHFIKYILRHRVQYQVVLNVFSSVQIATIEPPMHLKLTTYSTY